MIEFYNAAKGGVDTFHQTNAVNSCSRKTLHWPLIVLYGILNAACTNSFIISCENQANRGMNMIKMRSYMMELGNALITPQGQARLSTPFLFCQLHTLITTVCVLTSLGSAAESPGTSYADSMPPFIRYSDCPDRSDRKTRYHCNKCFKPKCPNHLYPICGDGL